MDLQLNGKRALVTGSSSGIGEAIVKAIAAEGAAVLVHGRSAPRAEAVAAAIHQAGGRAQVVLGDLSTNDGAAEVARQALAGGPVDILVNNAGFYENRTWWTATPEDWLATLQSDLLSSVRLIQALVPTMKARGWGRVIQIGSGTGAQPFAGYPQYCAVNASRTNAAVSLARELKGTGVTSNVVSPGLVVTAAVREWFTALAPEHGWGETWQTIETGAVRDVLPNDVGRFGQPEEIAAVVAFLASPRSSFVSGANWRVDGGSTLGIN